MSNLFPVFIDIKGKKCVIIGGGAVAERKIRTLLRYGADITLISPDVTENIKKIIKQGKIKYLKKNYSKEDIDNAFLVVAATSDSKINAQIAMEAKFLINRVEKQERLFENQNIHYIVPAIYERRDLKIAVSTEFPSISRLIRDEISTLYGKEFALYVKYLKGLRNELKRKVSDNKKRRKIFKRIASKEIVSILRQYGFKKAKEEIKRIISET